MNEALNRVLRSWADSRLYWIPFTWLRPAKTEPLSWGTVALHAISGALWPGILVAVAVRLALHQWSLGAFLLPALVGGCAGFCWSAMIRLAWNQRARAWSGRGDGAGGTPESERLRVWERWLLQPLALAAVFALGLALVTGVENLRGNLALRQFEDGLRARKLPVALAEVLPSPVPDERNLALAPMFKPMLDYERPVPVVGQTNTSIRWRDPEGFARTQNLLKFESDQKSFQAFASEQTRAAAKVGKREEGDYEGKRHLANWTDGVALDLGTWRDYYRSLEDWPKPATPGTPAADVLVALSRNEADLKALRTAAAERPECRFPLRYEEGHEMLLPPLAVVKRVASMLRLRAAALLEEQRTAEALEDVRLGFRMGDTIRDEPILISLLVRIAIYQLVLQPVWEGCRDGRWDDGQLAALQQILARYDPLVGVPRALTGERVMAGQTYEWMARQPERLSGWWGPDGFEGEWGMLMYLRLTPRGWVRQNQVIHFRYLQTLVDDLAAARHHAQLPPAGARLEEVLKKNSPYTILASMLAPAVDGVSVKAFEAESWRRLALAGLALERHRLAEGGYPEVLEALVPRFLEAVPEDPMDGNPLRYARNPDGGFRLYSVGRDHRDDGGLRPARRAKSAFDPARPSDLVWR